MSKNPPQELKRVYVISAPSGGGKTTLNRMLVEAHPEIEISVSLTVRAPRPGEVEGKDYHFVSPEEFQRHVDAGEMLETAVVHDNLYGTSKQQLREIEERGHWPLLEIDVQGWESIRHKLRKSTSIFILPPSMKVLWQRLESRGTDDFKVRLNRLKNARDEISQARHYDFFVVNDSIESAFQELETIIVHKRPGRLDQAKGIAICSKLLDEFDNSDFMKDLRAKS